ncbi:uncharacterized protein LOC130676314 [Microplitis mediator]|uniref:uncharacterized protein LOC130676314 n=1 Tax=Microplitis mediator TaxID=375433 RepID=UPI0025526A20|nr:uncharacterized protein LOC130676314 [Microplitis mediator]
MPTCSNCKYSFTSIKGLLTHISILHAESDHQFDCGETDCNAMYGVKDTFRKHLQLVHKFPLNPPVTDNNNINIPSNQQTTNNCVKNINQQTKKNVEAPSSSTKDFQSALNTAAEKFVAKLYGNVRLPQNIVQTFIEDTQNFLGEAFLGLLQTKVDDTLEKLKCPPSDYNEINTMFDSLKNSFSHLQTEYKRLKFFSDCGTYNEPKSYVIDRAFVVTKTKKGLKGKNVDVCGQYIPLGTSLKNFCEQENTLQVITTYMDSLDKNSNVKENYIQGKSWKDKRSKYADSDIVIPYFLSGDDVELNDPLSGHSGKIMPIYASIPCLPPECRSQLNNFFLVLVYDSWVRMEKNKINRSINIYRPVINDIKSLEEKGIYIKTPKGVKHVYFVLGLIQGDNLGLHGLLGFTESFSATYYCRFCKLDKETCKNTVCIPPNFERNKENYDDDVELNNLTLTGIKEKCIFHKIKSFHAVENFSVDEMHDIREGMAHDDMIAILQYLTIENSQSYRFSLSELNDRLLLFDYGPVDSCNKPPPVREEDVKRGTKIKMTASEFTCFIKFFGLLVEDLVPETDPIWNLYILLRDILDFTLAKKVSDDQIQGFQSIVVRHHVLYQELTGKHLKPKSHFLLHYAKVCEQSGPIRPSVLIERNEISGRNWSDIIKNNPESYKTKWIEYKGTKYMPNMVVVLGMKDLSPIFAEITTIVIVDNETNGVTPTSMQLDSYRRAEIPKKA